MTSQKRCNDFPNFIDTTYFGHFGGLNEVDDPLICGGGSSTSPETKCFSNKGSDWFEKSSSELIEGRNYAASCQSPLPNQQLIVSGGEIGNTN